MASGDPPLTFDDAPARPNTAAARKEAIQAATVEGTGARTEASRASTKRSDTLLPLQAQKLEGEIKTGDINRQAAQLKLDASLKRLGGTRTPEKLQEARNLIMVELNNALEAKKLSREMFGASGLGFSTTSLYSGSPASSVNSLLSPIKANTAFNRLQKMRTESPTGGALGAVSDKELNLLVSSEASIDPTAGDKVFQSGLDTVIGNRIEALMALGADPLELARIIPPEDLPTYKDKFRAYRFLEDDVAAMNKYLTDTRKNGTYDPADFADLMGQAYYNATGRAPNEDFLGSAFETGIKYGEKPEATLNAFDYAAADEDIQKRIGSAAYKGDEDLTLSETLGGAALNFIPSTFELAYDTVYALTLGLPDTIEGVVDVIGGATGLSKDDTAYEALKQYYGDRYGSVQGFAKALQTDPASILADVAGLATGGATILAKTANVASKVSKISALSNAAKAAETFGAYAAKLDPMNAAAAMTRTGVKAATRAGEAAVVDVPARFAGTTPDTVKQAFDAGKRGSEEFKEFASGTGDFTVPLDKAEKALGELYQQRSTDYTRRMARLKKSDETLEFADVEKAIEGVRNVGRHKGIDISAAADVWDEVDAKYMEFLDKGLNTIEDFDAMKRAIKTIGSKYQPGTPQFKVANDVAKAVNDVIVDKAPVYANIMKDYRQASDVLTDVKATLGLGAASPDTVLNKLRRNAEGRTARGRTVLDLLEQTPSGKGIGDMLAGKALSSDVATGAGAGLTAPAAMVSGSPEVLAAGMITPKSLGEKAYQMGQVYGPAERAISSFAENQKVQAATDLAQKYGPQGMAALRVVNPALIQPQMDPADTVQSFTAEEQPTPEGYIAPFPVADMATPDALRLKQFYGAPDEASALNLDAFRAAQPAAGSAETAAVSPSADGKLYIGDREVYLDEVGGAYKDVDTDEVVQAYARGGTVQAPIGLRNGGQPKAGYDYGNAARTFGQGLTFGFGDEIEAKLRTLAAKDPNAYANEVKRIRLAQERYADANPMTAGGLEMAGMVGGAMLTPSLAALRVPGAIGRVAARAPRLSRFAAEGVEDALQGAAYSAGKAKPEPKKPETSRMQAVRNDAAGNALTYMQMSGAGALGKKGFQKAVATKPGYQAALAVRNFARNPFAILRGR
jgi:hypothetical protein